MVLKRDSYMCQPCLRAGRHRIATTVHHKVEVQDDPDKALSMENLESVCDSCHNRAHKRGFVARGS